MSGGHFDHQQYRLEDIAVQIEELIRGIVAMMMKL